MSRAHVCLYGHAKRQLYILYMYSINTFNLQNSNMLCETSPAFFKSESAEQHPAGLAMRTVQARSASQTPAFPHTRMQSVAINGIGSMQNGSWRFQNSNHDLLVVNSRRERSCHAPAQEGARGGADCCGQGPNPNISNGGVLGGGLGGQGGRSGWLGVDHIPPLWIAATHHQPPNPTALPPCRNAWALHNGICARKCIILRKWKVLKDHAWIFETRLPQLAWALSIAVAGWVQKSRAQSMT